MTDPIFFIQNQNDFLTFINNTSYTKGIFLYDFTVNASSWTTPTQSIGSGRIIEGSGKIVTLLATSSNIPWDGFFQMTGGAIQNFTVDVVNSGGNILLNDGESFVVSSGSSGTINGILLKGSCDVNGTRCGGILGENSSCTITTCQYAVFDNIRGIYGADSSIGGSGGIVGNGFSGSITDSVGYAYVYNNYAGVFCGNNAANVQCINCKSNGTLTGSYTGGFFGGVASLGCTARNCYSLVTLSSATAGGIVGLVEAGENMYVHNFYWLGTKTDANAGTIGTFNDYSYINLMNVGTDGGYMSASSGTDVYMNTWNVQKFNNDVNFTGVSDSTKRVNCYAYDSTNNILYIGGDFTEINGQNISYLAKWDGTTLSAVSDSLGYTVNFFIYTMYFVAGSLYIGGPFTQVGSINVGGVAKYNPSTNLWSGFNGGFKLGTPTPVESSRVDKIVVISDTNIYAGGNFTQLADGTTMNRISRWNGTSWTAMAGGFGGATIYDMARGATDNEIIIVGSFSGVTTPTLAVSNITIWRQDTAAFYQVLANLSETNNGLNGSIRGVGYLSSTDTIYVGGLFTTSGGAATINCNRAGSLTINSRDDTNKKYLVTFNTLGLGVNGSPLSGYLINNQYFVIGGGFTGTGNTVAPTQYLYNLGIYNILTSKWSSVAYYLSNLTDDSTAFGVDLQSGILYLGGTFRNLYETYPIEIGTPEIISRLNGIAQINLNNNITNYTSGTSSSTQPISNFNKYP